MNKEIKVELVNEVVGELDLIENELEESMGVVEMFGFPNSAPTMACRGCVIP